MATKRSTRPARPKLPKEVRAAYVEVQGGVRTLGKSIRDVQQSLQRAEKHIEAEARARITALRKEAKSQIATLRAHERDATKLLARLQTAAQGSWRDLKASADALLQETRTTAAGIRERFRSAMQG